MKYILSIVPILGLFTGTVLGYSYVSPTPEPQELRQVIETVQPISPEVLSASISAEVEPTSAPTPSPTQKPTSTPTSTPSSSPTSMSDDEKNKICEEKVKEKVKEVELYAAEMGKKQNEAKKAAQEKFNAATCDGLSNMECQAKAEQLRNEINNAGSEFVENEHKVLENLKREVVKIKEEQC